MLEDEQRFEELEAKLAALSSQVEGLELEKEVDPFLEDDVRRLIEDFREKEIAQLEEDDDLEDSDEQGSGNDFIDVQTTGGLPFKVHWISPESCDNITKATARAAFAAGAAERYGTSQQVNSGDVLILLCRKPTGSEAPAKFCQYIGMAVNTGLSPTSAEPTAADVESVTSSVGNYEIFVWSSCECSSESFDSVAVSELTQGSSSSSADPYTKVGSDGSSISESVSGLLTGLEVTNTAEKSPLSPLESTVLKDQELTTNEAGFKASLTSLSEKLTDYYVNYSSKSLSLNASTKNIDTLNFNSNSIQSKTSEITGSECGGLQAVSLSSYSLDVIQAGASVISSTPFVNSAKVSLGVSIYKDGSVLEENFIPSYRAETNDNIDHPENKKLFLPVVSDIEADSIAVTEEFNTSILEKVSLGTLSTGDEPLKDHYLKLYESVSQKDFASGLLYNQNSESEAVVSLSGIPLIDKNNVVDWHGGGVTGVSLEASSPTEINSNYVVSLGATINYDGLFVKSGLLHEVSLGRSILGSTTITIPKPPPVVLDGTSENYTPELFKVTSTTPEATVFYQKSVSIFSSNALIDFDKGLAVSISNPIYSSPEVLSLDASNHTGSYSSSYIDALSIRNQYDVIYSDSSKGAVSYYIDYTVKTVTTNVQNGLVTSITEDSTGPFSEGPIIVPSDIPLKYSCDPDYGCQPDPAGEFDEPTCGGGCSGIVENLLTFRPARILKFDPEQSTVLPVEIHNINTTEVAPSFQGYGEGTGTLQISNGLITFNGSELDTPDSNGVYFTAG